MKKIMIIVLTFCVFAFCEFTLESKIDNAIYPINNCTKIKPDESPWNSISVVKDRKNKNATKVAYRCENLSFYMIQVDNKLHLFLSGINENTDNIFVIRLLTETNWESNNGKYIDMGMGRYEEMDENNIAIIDESSPYNEYGGVKIKIFEIYDAVKRNVN